MSRRVKCNITVSEPTRGRREFPVQRVSNYVIETNIDSDADPFSIDIPDPDGFFQFLKDRDVEIVTSIFTDAGNGQLIEQLHSGIADDFMYDSSDRVLSITGRDFSCLASDTDQPPGEWKHRFLGDFIRPKARELGFPKVIIPATSSFNRIYTDGSETVWQFWYRLCREKDFFLWTQPDATLICAPLNYDIKPKYLFGTPARKFRGTWHPVEDLRFHRNAQQRLNRVWLYGERGDKPMKAEATDDSTSSWIRKNLKIQLSVTAKNQGELNKSAQDELYDSVVGAVEFTLVIPDRGVMIRQNQMAYVHLPDDGLDAQYYIVGVRMVGDSEDGYKQEVRFRESGYALQRRVPDAPTPPKASKNQTTKDEEASVPYKASEVLAQCGVRWGSSFVKAAKAWHKGEKGSYGWDWDLTTALGVLLSICQIESSFRNLRTYSDPVTGDNVEGPEWYEKPDPGKMNYNKLVEDWYHNFANREGNAYNPNPKKSAAVGPMQLVTPEYKQWADDIANVQGEYAGGRWIPDANIHAAARALFEDKGAAHAVDSAKDNQIWLLVGYYYGGPNPDHYVAKVKKWYDDRFQSCAAAALKAGATPTTPTGDGFTIGDIKFPPMRIENETAIRRAMSQLGVDYHWAGGDCNGPTKGSQSPSGAIAKGSVGFDCSGLILYAWCPYKKLPHYSGAGGQFSEGTEVGRDELKPADTVFFHGETDPQHVGMYLGNGIFINAPKTGDVVRTGSVEGHGGYVGAKRYFPWETTPVGPTAKGVKRVMIQAGHDEGGHGQQPYGHGPEQPAGDQSGAPGEQAFTKAVRDSTLAYLQSDNRFDPMSGSAWSASAGATAGTGDDIDFSGDMFISIHYDPTGSSFFFGWPRDRGSSRAAAGSKLADSLAATYTYPGTRNTGLDQSNERLWGYYAYGSPSRSSPDDVDHISTVAAAVIMECGSDTFWLNSHVKTVAYDIYKGICKYYGFQPMGA